MAVDTNGQHGSSLRAAAQALENPVTGGWLQRSVSGSRLGMRVAFRDKMQGWQVTAVGIETTPSFEIRCAPQVNAEAAFGVRFKTVGNPESREILMPEIRIRIVDLGPSRITLHRGTLTLLKKYRFYFVEREKIEEAMQRNCSRSRVGSVRARQRGQRALNLFTPGSIARTRRLASGCLLLVCGLGLTRKGRVT